MDSSGLICGGADNNWDTCIQWSPDTGTWEGYLHLSVRRQSHVSWTTGNGTYLMGGMWDGLTTTLLTPGGTQKRGFPLRYVTR